MAEMDPLEEANNSEESQKIAREATASAAKPSFKEAFASARRAGDSTFEWNGKKFTTELATEKKAAPKAEPKAAPKVEEPAPKAAPKAEPKTEAPVAKTEAPAAPAKKETYRDFSGKIREKSESSRPDIGGGIGRGIADFFGSIRERGRKSNPEAYAKGGMTASKRADGIATKGKTRGRYL